MTHGFRYFFLGEKALFLFCKNDKTRKWQCSTRCLQLSARCGRFLKGSPPGAAAQTDPEPVVMDSQGDRAGGRDPLLGFVSCLLNKIIFRIKFEKLHYNTVGKAFPRVFLPPHFSFLLELKLPFGNFLPRQHLLTFGYPFGHTKENTKLWLCFSLNSLQSHTLI